MIDPTAPKNPNPEESPTVADSGIPATNQDPTSDINVTGDVPGGINTSYSGGASAKNREAFTPTNVGATSGIMHSSVKGGIRRTSAQSSEWDGIIADQLSSISPVAPIAERREISRRTTFGPGQGVGMRPGGSPINPGVSQVPLSPNDLKSPDNVVAGSVWQPGTEDVVAGSKRVISNDLTSYPVVGDIIDLAINRANPSVDISAREAAGSSAGQDPNAETIQNDHRGIRKESTSWQPHYSQQKTDMTGAPTGLEARTLDGRASSDRAAPFRIFQPPAVPTHGKELRSVSMGEANNQATSASGGLEGSGESKKANEFSFVSRKGSFYGVDALYVPTAPGTESAVLGPAISAGLVLVAKTMPRSVITEGAVSSIVADIRNTSDVTSYHNVTVMLDVIDSLGNAHAIIRRQTNIPPGRAIAVSSVVPASVPAGALAIIATLKSSDGVELLSSRFDTIIAPKSFGAGKIAKGERLTNAVKNALGIVSAPTPLVAGRAYPKVSSRDLVATNERISGVIKISQKAKDEGFTPKVTVSVDPQGTPSTTVHSDRVKIGAVEVDPLTHEVIFDVINVTIGDAIRVTIEDVNGASKPSYAWAMYSQGLVVRSDLTGSCVSNGTFISGSIDTGICNSTIVAETLRTGTRMPMNTDENGNVKFYQDGVGSIVRSDAINGDTLRIYYAGPTGAYFDTLFDVSVSTDTGGACSTNTSGADPIRALSNQKPIPNPRFPTYVR